MAKYQTTDFYPWEKLLMAELRAEGKYVYTLIDTGGFSFQIRKGGFVNRFGYMITDEEIPMNEDEYIGDREFENLNWEECSFLKMTKKDISAELERAKQEYLLRQEEIREKWLEYAPYETESNRLRIKYGFYTYCRHEDKEKDSRYKHSKTTPYYEDGKEIILQCIHVGPEVPADMQDVRYFLLQNNEMLTESKYIRTARECPITDIFKAIEKQESLKREKNRRKKNE